MGADAIAEENGKGHPISPEPAPGRNELLKERLLCLYDKGEKDRCRRLLNMLPLGGRRPSELLAKMLQLCLRDNADGKIIR